ncbi:hypothetical protein [Aliidiomarina celeris]|uniref:hypothetical protein n=1 Tax=Aliidiomarina celeris TaxID=2249428 RepID=UPI000DEA56A1|nr:hypothetical protein [Aliidiomarina celeris]
MLRLSATKAYGVTLAVGVMIALASTFLGRITLPFWGYGLWVCVLAWGIFAFYNPLRTLKRQAILSHTLNENSSVRRRFWDSGWSRLGLWFFAVAAAYVLSLQLQFYRPHHWLLIAAFALLFPVLRALAETCLRTHVHAQWQRIAALRLASWFTFILFMLALVVVEYFWVFFPDTRHLTANELFTYEFQRFAGTEPSLQQAVVGLLASTEAVSWHLMQHGDYGWWLFLALNAVKFAVLQWVLLGIFLAFSSPVSGEHALSRRSASALALLALALAASVHFASWQQLQSSWLAVAERAKVVDPCSPERVAAQREQLQDAQTERLNARRQAFDDAVSSEVDQVVERVFAHGDQAVERFLDWNFSIRGQYQQLGYFLASSVTEASFAEFLGERANQELMAELEPLLALEHERMAALWQQQLIAEQHAHEDFVQRLYASSACFEPVALELNVLDNVELQWSGAGTGAAVVVSARLAMYAARVTGRHGVRRVMAALFTRLGLRAGAIGSSSLGAACGPLAPLCGSAIAVGSWLAIDYGLVAFDEVQHRAILQSEMLLALDTVKEDVKAALSQYYSAQLNTYFDSLEALEQERFRISNFND